MRYAVSLILVICWFLSGCSGPYQGTVARPAEMSLAAGNPFAGTDASPFGGGTAQSGGSFAFGTEPARGVAKTRQPAGDADPTKPMMDNRMVVYTADLTLRVSNVRMTAKGVEDLIKKHEGFVQRSSLRSITFRVKPEKFEAVLAELEAMGELVERNVSSEDVTDQYFDTELRIETAEKSRQRLIDLLESIDETKDVLEVERDIRRLTEEIERLKGALRKLGDRVQYATITVNLQAKVVDQVAKPERDTASPFEWVRVSGIDYILDQYYEEDLSAGGWKGPKFQLATEDDRPAPEGFVPIMHSRETLLAATPRDNRLRVRYIQPDQQGSADFWIESLAADLENRRGYDLEDPVDFDVNEAEGVARHITGETAYYGERWLYDAWVITEEEEGEGIIVVELARLKSSEEAESLLENVKPAIQGMEW